jgi:hypothetical protein
MLQAYHVLMQRKSSRCRESVLCWRVSVRLKREEGKGEFEVLGGTRKLNKVQGTLSTLKESRDTTNTPKAGILTPCTLNFTATFLLRFYSNQSAFYPTLILTFMMASEQSHPAIAAGDHKAFMEYALEQARHSLLHPPNFALGQSW